MYIFSCFSTDFPWQSFCFILDCDHFHTERCKFDCVTLNRMNTNCISITMELSNYSFYIVWYNMHVLYDANMATVYLHFVYIWLSHSYVSYFPHSIL